MSEKPKITVYLIGFDESVFADFRSLLGPTEYRSVMNVDEFGALAEQEEFPGVVVPLVLCDSLISEVNPSEVAQIARMKFPLAKIYFITKIREQYDKKILLKNGFNDSFLLPIDKTVLASVLKEVSALLDPENVVLMKPVKLVDMDASTELDFDVRVRLPRNKKFVTYSRKGESVDVTRLNKLNNSAHDTLYIDSKDTQAFYQYSAKVLKGLSKSAALGETEKQERIQSSVRNLFSSMFSDPTSEGNITTGKEMFNDCKQIVDEFILADDTPEWYSKFKKTMGSDESNFSHATRVSTYAALFSIGLQVGNPEELAIAGMFHDLGLAELPEALQEKSYEEMTSQEKDLYHLHPEMSVRMLKMKKFVAPNSVYDMILQHHERNDGRGFPKGYTPPKLMIESQLLSLADAFDYESVKRQDKEQVKPVEVLNELKKIGAWDPQLVNRVIALMTKAEQTG
ncbi:MAG TPA: HD domain-containing phosphohydrolase [Bdellovibrionota bacterium]|jgi:HD-GYP domain-containing protein (c-di-GMP phosphodiesterase class II)|nr:HD domain-containing phosphohydrolase [Bdellovibrionota bacterium]